MMADGSEDEAFESEDPNADPPEWRAPTPCPQCGQTQTRLVTRRYEMSVYECELCGAQFEAD